MPLQEKNIANIVLTLVYVALVLWWVLMFLNGNSNESHNYMFAISFAIVPLLGGIFGFANSAKWGMLKSSLGKGLFFISLGLITWALGQIIFSYYNIFLNVEIPYPSVADASFILSWPLWGIGVFHLSRATGARYGLKSGAGKAILVLFPILIAVLSYYLLVVVARGGQFDFAGSSGLKVFFDLAYPIGDVVILTIATVIYGLSHDHLGGRFKTPIYLLLAGFILNYVADFSFSYTTTLGSFFSANWVDLLFMTAMFILGRSIVLIRPPVVSAAK